MTVNGAKSHRVTGGLRMAPPDIVQRPAAWDEGRTGLRRATGRPRRGIG